MEYFFLKQQSDKVNTHSIYSMCHSSLMIRLGKSLLILNHPLGREKALHWNLDITKGKGTGRICLL